MLLKVSLSKSLMTYFHYSSRWGASAGGRRRSERGRRARSSDSLALDYELLLQNKPRTRNMQRLTGNTGSSYYFS